MSQSSYIVPSWDAPHPVKAYTTTRLNGHSSPPYDSFNLAAHVNDDPTTVQQNREQLMAELSLPSEPVWLNQVHGTHSISLDGDLDPNVMVDASFTQQPNRVCAVLTADCLPILLAARNGREVAAIHAGWRGLLAGVIEATLEAMNSQPSDLIAWLGPAIGPEVFEINEEIRSAFIRRNTSHEVAFQQRQNRWYGDLYRLSRMVLSRHGVVSIHGGNFCTYQDDKRFFSYRRAKGPTGRMASLIWIEAP